VKTGAIVMALVIASAGAKVFAQYGGFGRRGGAPIEPNIKYDGRFAFVRLRYGPPVAFQSQRVQWSHDYPAGERHFMKIMNEVSFLNPHMDESNVMALDDPELMRYPVAYMCEPGFWYMSDEEAAAFRNYLLKGGFVIFDDFAERRGGWNNFAGQMARVLPEFRWFDLDLSSSVYHSFFEVKTLDVPQYYDFGPAIFRGIFEDNDPTKRLIAVANFNTDISEYWEFSDTGLKPIDESNEAYKLGVNYIIYGLTH
jgi:Domain of unknown function (DUF4159)